MKTLPIPPDIEARLVHECPQLAALLRSITFCSFAGHRFYGAVALQGDLDIDSAEQRVRQLGCEPAFDDDDCCLEMLCGTMDETDCSVPAQFEWLWNNAGRTLTEPELREHGFVKLKELDSDVN